MSETVSVVIPTYYRNEQLRRAIESAREQTHKPVEIIVVDDSGEGFAAQVCEEFGDVTYVEHRTNEGAHASRNTGAQHITGEYVQFLDDDDVIDPEKFRKQIDLLDRREGVGVAYCAIAHDDGTTFPPDPAVRGDVLEHALRFVGGAVTTSTLLIERDVLERTPDLNRDCEGAGDLRMVIKLAERTRFDFVDEVLVRGGASPDSLGTSWGAVRDRWEMLSDFEDLYDSFDPSVRNAAMAHTYRFEARRLLNDRTWSLRAIVAFAKGLYWSPSPSANQFGELLSLVGGRPGREFAKKIR